MEDQSIIKAGDGQISSGAIMLGEFPQILDGVIKEAAKTFGVSSNAYEYHGVEIRELYWYEGKKVVKNIRLVRSNEFVSVSFTLSNYPFWSKLWVWCHKNIPEVTDWVFYPVYTYVQKRTKLRNLDKLPLHETPEFYRKKLCTYVNYAKNAKTLHYASH